MKEHVVMITGAARGFGKELARQFDASGYQVIATARNIPTETKTKWHWHKLDISNYDQCKAVINTGFEKFGRLDILINNASAYTGGLSIADISKDDIDRELNTTLRGTIYLTKLYAEKAKTQGFGKIIFISSVAGLEGEDGCEFHSVYSAAKAGLIRFAETIDEDIEKFGMQAHVFIPGNLRDVSDNSGSNAITYEDVALELVRQAKSDKKISFKTILRQSMSLFLALFAVAVLVSPTVASPAVFAPPAFLQLSPFYKKYCDAAGLPVLGSDRVSDSAIIVGREIIVGMLSKRPDILAELKRQNIRIAVMAPSEVTTDIPEHSDLYEKFPKTDWNKRCRGVGATFGTRTCSCAEENLLQLPTDRYRGENILIHEFGHTILNIGIAPNHPEFLAAVKRAYANAMSRGLWNNTYAATSFDEYWAEGVQDWFDANIYMPIPNGIHNKIHTQEQLWQYDPELAKLLSEVFPANLKWDGGSRLIYR